MHSVSHDELMVRCAARRERLFEVLGDGLLILRTAPTRLRNGDVHHTFRPGSDLHYLCGYPEPSAILCAWREAVRRGHAVRTALFVLPKDKEREIWDGKRFGTAGAKRRFGVDQAYPIEAFWETLPGLLKGLATVFHRLGVDSDFDARLLALFGRLAFQRRKANVPAHPAIVDPFPAIGELRVIKDDLELALLERAATISAAGHVAAMAAGRPGVTESQVQAAMEDVFRRSGSPRNGYDSIVASGANACILHYHANDRTLRRGELLLLDAGAEFGMYTADITRTWPVDGTFRAPQAAVYDAVLKAQAAAIRAIGPGKPIDGMHRAAVRSLTKSLVQLGALKGDVAKLVEKDEFKRYYMHGTGHYLGLDVHDAGAYQDVGGRARSFEPGMVVTVEPGLYFDPRDPRAPRDLRGIGVRIEDDVLVTADGTRILTAACPKLRRDVEAACRGVAQELPAPRRQRGREPVRRPPTRSRSL